MKKADYNEEEFENLKEENEKIRKKIDDIIGLEYPLYSPLWVAINELVENELQQEEMCN